MLFKRAFSRPEADFLAVRIGSLVPADLARRFHLAERGTAA